MNEADVRRWLKKNQAFYIRLYGLDRWELDIITWDNEESPPRGDCSLQTEYERATIRLFPGELDDELDLQETFCHELEHVLTAPFFMYFETINKLLPRRQQDTYMDMFIQVAEQSRNAIGRFRKNALQLSEPRRRKKH